MGPGARRALHASHRVRFPVLGPQDGVGKELPMHTKAISRGSEQKRKIETAIRSQLISSGHYALRKVSCKFEDNVLKLSGRVPTYYEKQLAQNLVMQQLPVELTLENRLEVGQGIRGGTSLHKSPAKPHPNRISESASVR